MKPNKQLLLKKRPVGLPEKDTWELVEANLPQPNKGEFLIKCEYISLDPAMRGWLNDTKSYIPPVQINEVMRAGGVGKIIESKHSDFKEGDYVYGQTGVQQYVTSDGKGFHLIDPDIAPLPMYLGALGMTGMTAYFGILEVGKLREGDTVLVSGAAGAVGSVVGQIAKIKNCKVIGIAGGTDKCKYLVEELGFDGAIDYKNDDIRIKLKEYFPKGIDVYFDNVGGEILDICLERIAMNARVVICGGISRYNATEPVPGPKNYFNLVFRRARMEGFIVIDYIPRFPEAIAEMKGWIEQGLIKQSATIVEGFENLPKALIALFEGANTGKMMVKTN
jgi:NADPH-dependent curcumin reductase CurA